MSCDESLGEEVYKVSLYRRLANTQCRMGSGFWFSHWSYHFIKSEAKFNHHFSTWQNVQERLYQTVLQQRLATLFPWGSHPEENRKWSSGWSDPGSILQRSPPRRSSPLLFWFVGASALILPWPLPVGEPWVSLAVVAVAQTAVGCLFLSWDQNPRALLKAQPGPTLPSDWRSGFFSV